MERFDLSRAPEWLKLGVVCAALIAWAGCGKGAPEATEEGAPGFRQLHARIFQQPTCASSACHDGARGIAGLSFSDPEVAYAHLVNGTSISGAAQRDGLKLVVPGSPERSLLYLKVTMGKEALTEAGYGAAMPFTGPGLGPKSVGALRRWIEAGAPMDGADFEADFLESADDDAYVRCDAEDEAGLKACLDKESPRGEGVMRLYSPPITVPAESEIIYCSYLDVKADQDWRITRTEGQQMTGGHHAVVFMAVTPSDDHTPHECTNEEMTNFQFVAGAGGASGVGLKMPEGFALRVPKGRQIVIQSHYINTSDRPRVVMDSIDMTLAKEGEEYGIVDPFALIYSDFEIPPGEELEHVKECTVNKTRKIYSMLGHTHDYGILFEMELLREGEEEPSLLYRAIDGPLLRDNPEVVSFDDPLVVNPGDSLRMRCKWRNTTEEAIGWPEEMCVALMYYGPGEGWLTCSNDAPRPRIPTGDEGCAAPLDQGNALGVGEYCTERGGECGDNVEARFCLTPFDPSSNFCSMLGCEQDVECGEGARCVVRTQGSACVPDKCFDE